MNLFAQVFKNLSLGFLSLFFSFELLEVLKVELKISAAERIQLHNSLYYSSCVLYDKFLGKRKRKGSKRGNEWSVKIWFIWPRWLINYLVFFFPGTALNWGLLLLFFVLTQINTFLFQSVGQTNKEFKVFTSGFRKLWCKQLLSDVSKHRKTNKTWGADVSEVYRLSTVWGHLIWENMLLPFFSVHKSITNEIPHTSTLVGGWNHEHKSLKTWVNKTQTICVTRCSNSIHSFYNTSVGLGHSGSMLSRVAQTAPLFSSPAPPGGRLDANRPDGICNPSSALRVRPRASFQLDIPRKPPKRGPNHLNWLSSMQNSSGFTQRSLCLSSEMSELFTRNSEDELSRTAHKTHFCCLYPKSLSD